MYISTSYVYFTDQFLNLLIERAPMPRQIPFQKLRAALFSLTLEQAKELQQVLTEIIHTLETARPPTVKTRQGREVVEVVHRGDRLYQRELIKCGK